MATVLMCASRDGDSANAESKCSTWNWRYYSSNRFKSDTRRRHSTRGSNPRPPPSTSSRRGRDDRIRKEIRSLLPVMTGIGNVERASRPGGERPLMRRSPKPGHVPGCPNISRLIFGRTKFLWRRQRPRSARREIKTARGWERDEGA
jgi:hypothetical protein